MVAQPMFSGTYAPHRENTECAAFSRGFAACPPRSFAPRPVFDEARRHLSESELVELTLLVGLYASVAMVVALARPELDRYGV